MKMIVPLRSVLHVRWDQMSALEQLIDARKIPFDWYMWREASEELLAP